MTGISDNSNILLGADGLLEKISQKYGYDFTEYAQGSLHRRINKFLLRYNYSGIEELSKAIDDPDIFEKFIEELIVTVTEMFRDPSFFLELRKKVIPMLSTYPYIKIWDAGCATGEELFSLAIVLKEEGLLHKTRIYATDISQKVLLQAKEAIFPLSELNKNTQNYKESGGKYSLSDYYTSKYNAVVFDGSLIENVIFYPHNLVTDASFNEFNLIICRNVLIYFQRKLQEKVFKLFYDSLYPLGFLVLGKKETLSLSNLASKFDVINKEEKIFRKNSF